MGSSAAIVLDDEHFRSHPEVKDAMHYFFCDRDRRWVYVSDGLCDLLERSPQELRGSRMSDWFAAGIQYTTTGFERLLATGSHQSLYALQTKSGRTVGVIISGKVLGDGCILGIFTVVSSNPSAATDTPK